MRKSKPFKWFAGIFGTVAVAAISAFVTQWVTDKSPEIIVRQYYNVISAAEVPQKVGELLLDYQIAPSPRQAEGVYIIEVANEGRAPEEGLRVQAAFPSGAIAGFYREPDFRVYDAGEMKLEGNKLFVVLNNFPVNALAPIQFVPAEDRGLLCHIEIKAAGRLREGIVKPIEGIECE